VPAAGMEPMVPRVTLTLPLFNTAREVVFLVAGGDKADAVARAFGTPPDESAPAAMVRPGAGKLIVVLDEPAAAKLAREAVTSSTRSGGKRAGRDRGEAG
jgi:6-phosphogluconolactonase